MGKNRKRFIDKKSAHHFYVMHRSQQDPLYYKDTEEGGSKFVLQPANERTAVALEALDEYEKLKGIEKQIDARNNNFASKKVKIMDEVDELGLPVDGYDYHQHLAEISGNGIFVSVAGTINDPSEEPPKEKLNLPKEVFASEKEYDRMLEAITLKEETMDPEIREMLDSDFESDDDSEADDFEKYNADPETLLDDDFVMQLVQKEEEAEINGDTTDEFDFDKHMKRLMEKAEAEDEWDDSDDEDFQMNNLEKQLQEVNLNREEREIDRDFEALLAAEYNDDDDDEDREIAENNEANVDLSKDIDQLKEMPKKYTIPSDDEDEISEEVKDATKMLTEVLEIKQEEAEKEVLEEMDTETVLKSFAPGYDYKPRTRYNCQTIVSTYSTTENHPTTISLAPSMRLRKKMEKKYEMVEEVDSEHDDSDLERETVVLENLGVKRDKTESIEDKKLRKQRVKEMKQERRKEKKGTKLMFKEEKSKQIQQRIKRKEAAVPPEGVSNFRI